MNESKSIAKHEKLRLAIANKTKHHNHGVDYFFRVIDISRKEARSIQFPNLKNGAEREELIGKLDEVYNHPEKYLLVFIDDGSTYRHTDLRIVYIASPATMKFLRLRKDTRHITGMHRYYEREAFFNMSLEYLIEEGELVIRGNFSKEEIVRQSLDDLVKRLT